MIRLRYAIAFWTGLGSAAEAAHVLVVSPTGPYSQIQAAVDAAWHGNIVLVKPGSYSSFTIDGKGIAVIADSGAVVNVAGGITIKNVPLGRTVVLDRVNANADFDPTWTSQQALRASDCGGAIRVQGGTFVGRKGTGSVTSDCGVAGSPNGSAAIRLDDCRDVSFTGVLAEGGNGSDMDSSCGWTEIDWSGGEGGAGLYATDSSVSAYSSTFVGGTSGSGPYSDDAGHGFIAFSSSPGSASWGLVLVDVAAVGGVGGPSNSWELPSPGGDGGSGLLVGDYAITWILDSTFAGGVQGHGVGYPGGAVAPAIAGNGVIQHWSGPAKSLGALKVVREGQNLVIGFAGSAGDSLMLLASPSTASFVIPAAKGSLLANPAALIGPLPIGVLPNAAPFYLEVVTPSLPPGFGGVEIYVQGLMNGSSGATLTNWNHVTLLDAAF